MEQSQLNENAELIEVIDARCLHNAEQVEQMKRTLVEIARANGVTHEVIARRMGVSVTNVEYFEHYSFNPKMGEIKRYANAVGARLSLSVVNELENPLEDLPFKICQLFHLGMITKDQLVEKLTNFPYAKNEGTDGYDSLMVSSPGSWDEVVQAVASGLISSEIYAEVFNSRHPQN